MCWLWDNLWQCQTRFWLPQGLFTLTNVCVSIIFFRLTSLFQKSVISQLLFDPVDGSLLLQHKQFGANVIPDSFGWLDSLMLFTLAFLSLQVLLSRPSVKGGPWKHSHTIQLKRNIYRKCLESFWLVFSYGQMETLVLKTSIQILKGECWMLWKFSPCHSFVMYLPMLVCLLAQFVIPSLIEQNHIEKSRIYVSFFVCPW